MSKPIPPHDDVRSAFDDGSILTASKEQLELFLVANGQARILHGANQARASEMGETMRQLLAARQSEAMHSQALRVSKVALWVSVVALVLGIPGAFYAIQAYVSPSPTEVYFRTTIPVSVQNSVKLEQQEQKTAPQKQQKQSLSPN
jgi:hypothetical protein